ncbi:hypothetical protein C1631_000660 [Chryseobacterium phosphatilyticum]|uniref:Uncharacterized protein n=1 Tax=Chryseobacterium phosphatilyticum TaxID=475075 RepID=A0A316XEN4_9FLAO|nr:hypothetical protein [Chryseobacterium phosphatilyticum]PWN71166.1 hypothetical protein C1631_000660 [Chryseobacterium phosphatilyticum]
MKIKLIVSIISLFSVLSFGQTKKVNDEVGIKRDFTSFFKNIKEKNIENAVNFVYPKYIHAITREQMFKVLTLSYNNPAFITDIQDFTVDHVEKPELINGEYFSVADYSFSMKFKVDWKVIQDEESVKQKMSDLLMSRYGKDKVVYFSDGDYYFIKANMKACAVSKDQEDWKFLIIEKEYSRELINILPKKIMEKL